MRQPGHRCCLVEALLIPVIKPVHRSRPVWSEVLRYVLSDRGPPYDQTSKKHSEQLGKLHPPIPLFQAVDCRRRSTITQSHSAACMGSRTYSQQKPGELVESRVPIRTALALAPRPILLPISDL